MPILTYFTWWLVSVVALSTLLALFEIILEKSRGWASGLSQHGLGKHLLEGTAFVRVIEKPYITVYHMLMFGIVIPLILAGECSIIRVLGIAPTSEPPDIGILTSWRIGRVSFSPLLSSIAAWVAIAAIEDFLWFVLNWYYPDSLQDLLSGRIWWHTRWITIGRIKFPRSYITALLVAAILLSASIWHRS